MTNEIFLDAMVGVTCDRNASGVCTTCCEAPFPLRSECHSKRETTRNGLTGLGTPLGVGNDGKPFKVGRTCGYGDGGSGQQCAPGAAIKSWFWGVQNTKRKECLMTGAADCVM